MRVSSACPVLFSISLLTPIDHLKISERRGKINFLSSFKKKKKNLFLRRKRGFFLFFFFPGGTGGHWTGKQIDSESH